MNPEQSNTFVIGMKEPAILTTAIDFKRKLVCLRLARGNQVDRLEMPVETAVALRDQLSAQIERLNETQITKATERKA